MTTLEKLFNIPAKSTFEFELDTATGGAHTGTGCANLGDGVAYDAFVGTAYGATGYWGYLLSMHEAINVWTGLASSGWPTDWWADHQSAFPNLMDFHVMNTLGVENNDQNLIKAAAAQKKRFYPNGDSSDAKVVALDNVFMLMPGGDGYAGFSHMFALQTADGVKWDGLGVLNPAAKRSEYVAAYMSLAAGQSVLKTLQGPGANGGGEICDGTPDGTAERRAVHVQLRERRRDRDRPLRRQRQRQEGGRHDRAALGQLRQRRERPLRRDVSRRVRVRRPESLRRAVARHEARQRRGCVGCGWVGRGGHGSTSVGTGGSTGGAGANGAAGQPGGSGRRHGAAERAWVARAAPRRERAGTGPTSGGVAGTGARGRRAASPVRSAAERRRAAPVARARSRRRDDSIGAWLSGSVLALGIVLARRRRARR